MPNFPPLRNYVFSVVDRWIAVHRLEPPFLEIGAGTGALAAHLAEAGWEGTALDSSPHACKLARERLARWPGIRSVEGDLEKIERRDFRTIFLMDVLEHVKDDEALLRGATERLAPGGAMVLLVPVNPKEWSQDDEIYGHFRRYAWHEMEEKVKRAGCDLVESWNVTFPFMWALRRFYLRLLPRRPEPALKDELTAASSIYNPWDEDGFLRWVGAVAGWGPWWRPLMAVQNLFSRSLRGHAAMFLGRKDGR